MSMMLGLIISQFAICGDRKLAVLLKPLACAMLAAAGTAAVVVTQACDIDAALGPYIGTAGVAAVSYLLTYWIPNKK